MEFLSIASTSTHRYRGSDGSAAAPRWYRALGLAACLALPAAVAASPPGNDPTQANAAVPRIEFKSAFEGYLPAREVNVGSWRAANETVGRIGGWRAYAREAHGQGSPADPRPSSDQSSNSPAQPAHPPGHGK
jgi:hypothetical protein